MISRFEILDFNWSFISHRDRLLYENQTSEATIHNLIETNFKSLISKSGRRVYYSLYSSGSEPSSPLESQQIACSNQNLYIRTTEFSDTHDRILQHRDGEYSPLLEDITGYHHLLQQDNCDRLIILQSHEYSGYKTQITAAMQCIGYSPEQFHFIPIQPLKLYAFHRENNKVHPIPDLPLGELQKVVNPQTIRWYSLRVPLEEIAPLNLSTSSPEHPQNHFYRIQLAYAYTQKYLTLLKSHHLDSENTSETTPTNPEEQNLIDTLQSTEQILDRAIDEVAPHLICQHVEQISEQFLEWLPPKRWSPSSYATLQKVHDVLLDLVESKLGLTLMPIQYQAVS